MSAERTKKTAPAGKTGRSPKRAKTARPAQSAVRATAVSPQVSEPKPEGREGTICQIGEELPLWLL